MSSSSKLGCLWVATFIVRQLEDSVKAGLKRRAERHGRSMVEEVRGIPRNAVKDENAPDVGLGSRVAARLRRIGLTEDLPELCGEMPRPADLGR